MNEILDTIAQYGTSFQTKVLSTLLIDRPFLDQTFDIINPQYFESEANKWIAKTILWYFSEYKNIPTMEVFKLEVDKLDTSDVLRVSVIEQLKNVYINTKAQDLEYIKNEFLTFCKNQSIKNAILKSADLVQKGKYNEIKVLVDQAMHAGQERNVGHKWVEDVELRLSKTARDTIPTPWTIINQLLDGGLGPGELGCIIAPSGAGKSWLLRAIGVEALKRGKRVVDYSFELSDKYVGLRYDTIVTGIEPTKLKENISLVKQEISKISGDLIIKYFPTATASINHLQAHINRLINIGCKPDLVIIDYADLMRSVRKSNSSWEELGIIYEEVRGMLGELNVPGWTATQSQRSAMQDDVIEADKIAGAYSKIFVSDIVLSASRKLSDKISNTARIHIIKNRFGVDGKTFPAIMDLTHGKIEIYDENSMDGIRIKNQMQKGSGVIQQLLQKRLLDVRRDNSLDEDEVDNLISENLVN